MPGMLPYTPKTLRFDFTETFKTALRWADRHGYVGVHEKHAKEAGILAEAFSGAKRGGPRVTVFFKDDTRELYYDYGDFHYGADFHDYKDRFLFATRLTRKEGLRASVDLMRQQMDRRSESRQAHEVASAFEVLRKVYIPRVGEDAFRQRWEDMGHSMDDIKDGDILGYMMPENIAAITNTDPEMWRRMDREWRDSDMGKRNRKNMRKSQKEFRKFLAARDDDAKKEEDQ